MSKLTRRALQKTSLVFFVLVWAEIVWESLLAALAVRGGDVGSLVLRFSVACFAIAMLEVGVVWLTGRKLWAGGASEIMFAVLFSLIATAFALTIFVGLPALLFKTVWLACVGSGALAILAAYALAHCSYRD